MAQALLVSIGPDNKIFLEAHFNPDPLYSLSPRQIVDAMLLEHGTTSAEDLKKLRAPLYEPLKALADLERHMNAFLLASKKLTNSGQGKTPYEYFEAFLETLKGFPVVGSSMPTFYAQYPTMDRQTLAVLFPYLKAQHPYMLAQSVASPFSGAAVPPPTQKTKNKNKNKGKGKDSSSSTGDGRPPKWGPNGPKPRAGSPANFSGGIFGGAVACNFNQEDAYAEIQRLTHLLSQANPSAAWNNFGTQQALAGVYGQSSAVTVPSAFFSRSERPRPCYCFVRVQHLP